MVEWQSWIDVDRQVLVVVMKEGAGGNLGLVGGNLGFGHVGIEADGCIDVVVI